MSNEAASLPNGILSTVASESAGDLYYTLADAMPLIVWTSRPDGWVDYYNRRWIEYTGLTLEETQGWGWQAIIHPDDFQNAVDRWNEAIRTGEAYEIEYRLRRASDGSYRWHLGRSVPVRDSEGIIRQWIGTGTDIDDAKRVEECRAIAERELQKANEELENRVEMRTFELAETNRQLSREVLERAATEKRLGESEQRFRNSFDHAPIGISIVSPEGKWVEVNRTLCDMVGYSEEELLSIDFQKITHPDDLRIDIDYIRRMLDGSIREYQLEKRYFHKNGSIIWILLSVSLMRDESGAPMYFIAQIVDITERKRAEAILHQAKETAELGNRAKSDFLAVMSHEIRTPMNAVIGMTGLLLDTTLSEEQREYVETVRVCSEALLTIINDTLDFSKIESGMMELEEQPFTIRGCIEEALDLVAVPAGQKGIELSCMIAEGTPEMIVGDVTRVRQIVVNLLGNAVKFTGQGEVAVNVRSTPREDGRHEILFSVRDSGIGIAPSQIDRLFRSFSQVDLSTTRKYGGTGLGLAIAKMLCESMGGRIWVESRPGFGSKFSFTIVVPAHEGGQKHHEDRTMLQEKRVAIIVESEIVAEILRQQCEQWRMIPTVIAEYDGSRSLGNDYDLAIIDLRTRERLGLELRALVEVVRGGSRLPALLLSAMAVHELRQQNIDLEGIAFLSKPIKQSQMLDTVANLLGGPEETASTNGAARQDSAAGVMPTEPLRILLAEDNVVNQKVALGMMKGLGYRADIAANGLEVLEALERQPYDLIFMDVQMPEMDGLEASRRIRIDIPQERQPMIIAMTANAIAGYRDECLAAGMNGYITKPIRKSKLVDALIQAGACRALLTSLEKLPRGVDREIYQNFRDEVNESAPDALAEILECFLKDTPSQIASLMDALGERDRVLLRRTAHTLKSTSEMIGASRLAMLCRSLESDERAVESEVISYQVTRIEAEMREVVRFVEAEMGVASRESRVESPGFDAP
jgi:PAS domain S-box-containing protein